MSGEMERQTVHGKIEENQEKTSVKDAAGRTSQRNYITGRVTTGSRIIVRELVAQWPKYIMHESSKTGCKLGMQNSGTGQRKQ
jgi:hypothetical protein